MPASTTLKKSSFLVRRAAKSDPCLNELKKDKKVHFADALGLSLVSVCHFSEPIRVRKIFGIGPSSRSCHWDRIDKARLLNFVQPFCGKKLLEALERQAVCLESIAFREYSIRGNIKVKNLAYEKRLFIRHTLDNWTTCQETTAEYVYGSSTGSVDTFKFEMFIPEDLEKDIKIEFAICYQVLGSQIWDNNYGDNYRVIWYGSQKEFKNRDVLDIFQSSRYAGFWI